MKKTVRVKIGGQEYNLRSDDEAKVRDVAAMVDTQFLLIQGNSKEQSTATLSILTALNIAEQHYDARHQQQRDKLYLASEVEKMVAYLRQSLNERSFGEKSLSEKANSEKAGSEKSSLEKLSHEKPSVESSSSHEKPPAAPNTAQTLIHGAIKDMASPKSEAISKPGIV